MKYFHSVYKDREMKMYVFLVLIMFLEQGSSLSCYQCHSQNYRNCDQSKEEVTCENNEKHCYWLSYTDTIYNQKGKATEDLGFEKGCTNDCKSICEWGFSDGYKDCKAKCCEGNLCNGDTFKSQFERSKRTLQDSAAQLSTRNNILMIFLLVFSIFSIMPRLF